MFEELVSNITNVSVFTDSIKGWISEIGRASCRERV